MERLVKQYELTEGAIINEKGLYKLFLTPAQSLLLEQYKDVEFVKLSENTTPQDIMFNSNIIQRRWNQDNIGPIIVPGRNLTIRLTPDNISAYDAIICLFEHNKLSYKDSVIYINNQPTVYYTFRNNYYFLMDDNRDNANDSRNWGFLPESFIIGKVTRIILSFNFDNSWYKIVRWSRTLQKID